MERDYDIFEVLPDGQPIWRAAVAGHEDALRVLKQLAAKTTHEVRMMHLSAHGSCRDSGRQRRPHRCLRPPAQPYACHPRYNAGNRP